MQPMQVSLKGLSRAGPRTVRLHFMSRAPAGSRCGEDKMPKHRKSTVHLVTGMFSVQAIRKSIASPLRLGERGNGK